MAADRLASDARDAWAKDPVVLEQIMHAALKAGDAKGVVAALTLMATADPHRAELLLDTLKTGLHLAGATDER